MDADEVVIEYLRGKLQKARGARADSILKPAPEAASPEGEDMPPEEMAQLEALMQESGEPQAEESGESMSMEAEEPCATCGKPVGQCQCSKGL